MARNSPIPTPIARFSAIGMAFMTASRKPVSTRSVITTPSSTTTPIAPATELQRGDQIEGDHRVEPHPRGEGERIVGTTPMAMVNPRRPEP